MENKETMKTGDGFIDRSKVRILLCDNDSKSSGEVFTLLCKCSYQVTCVRSPRQVIDALNAAAPDIDIILCEVDLPMSKGMKLMKYIMRDKELRRIPVIMMSSQDEVSVVVKCLRLGAADYLVKPLRTNELLNLWTHMWRRRRMLGLVEKNMINYDFDLVISDPSDASTNSTALFSDDTDEKSCKSNNPVTSQYSQQEDEANATTSAAYRETAVLGSFECLPVSSHQKTEYLSMVSEHQLSLETVKRAQMNLAREKVATNLAMEKVAIREEMERSRVANEEALLQMKTMAENLNRKLAAMEEQFQTRRRSQLPRTSLTSQKSSPTTSFSSHMRTISPRLSQTAQVSSKSRETPFSSSQVSSLSPHIMSQVDGPGSQSHSPVHSRGNSVHSNVNYHRHTDEHTRLPECTGRKIDLPLFNGEGAYNWIIQMEKYFRLNDIEEEEKVEASRVAMEDRVLNWFHSWEYRTEETNWDTLKKSIIRRFQPELISSSASSSRPSKTLSREASRSQMSSQTASAPSRTVLLNSQASSLAQSRTVSTSSQVPVHRAQCATHLSSRDSPQVSLHISALHSPQVESVSFPQQSVSQLQPNSEDTLIISDEERGEKTSVVIQSIAMETEKIEEDKSKSEKKDKIEIQNQIRSSAGFVSLSYDQGYYSEHLKVADKVVVEKRLHRSPVTKEECEAHGCPGVDYKHLFGGVVMYWNPSEMSGTSFLCPPSLRSDDSSWAWRVADMNKVVDDRVDLVSSHNISFCSSFDLFGSEISEYVISGSKAHTGKVAQTTCVQEHPDISFLIQPFEMLNSPSEKESLSWIHINPHEEVNAFYKQFAVSGFSSELKVTCPKLSLMLAISAVKNLESSSTSAATTALDSSTKSLGVHQSTVKPEGGTSYVSGEQLALCLTRDGHMILKNISTGSLINSQPAHPEKDIERKDQTTQSGHEEQNNYNNQCVPQAMKLMAPKFGRYWEGRGARMKIKFKIKALSHHPP
ncbi:unnamed protein product [Cuscuta europaea]|uniref:Response regulatory domain-containing protein n=1 Tax=Cuscuta europaea TaxID=41803 RepID=A0A9P1EBA4_CUSEU|nr:unnamed protein product [Cuscuta europaea]